MTPPGHVAEDPLRGLGAIRDLVDGTEWSAERLRSAIHIRAWHLRRLGTAPGRHIVIGHADSPAFFADLMAVWSVGCCAVCVQPGLAGDEWRNVLAFVDAAALLVDGRAPDATALPAGLPVLDLGRDPGPAARDAVQAFHPLPWAARAPALVLFTSGTTGRPKGVVLSHAALQARIAENQGRIGSVRLARSLCVLPTHFGHGLIGNCLTPLLAGGTLHLMGRAGLAGARQLGAVVASERITFMSSVPAFWRLALRLSSPPPPGTLAQVHIGSAPLSAGLWGDVIRWTGTRDVGNLYGMTETANWAGGVLARELPPEDGLVGRPWGGEFAVQDEAGRCLPTGEGEVLVRSPSLMDGYLHRPDLTGEVLQEGWYRTGDRGHIDGDGVLRLTGRLRGMINRAGAKIYPEELDLLFERHPQVAEACAFGRADAASGESVHVAVRLRDGAQVQANELLAWARAQIRPDALPDRVHLLADLPKSDRGKPDRARVASACVLSPSMAPAVPSPGPVAPDGAAGP